MAMNAGNPLTRQDISARRGLVEPLMRQTAALALGYFRNPALLNVEKKGIQDYVTAADRAVEQALVTRIGQAFPDDAFVGEEGGTRGQTVSPAGCWYIDPIDGTTNFARGIPFWCISVAFVVGGRIELGLIYDPLGDEMFAAQQGGGATCNGRPMRVSTVTEAQSSRINIGFNFRHDPAVHLGVLERLFAEKCEFSRLGSTALGLAYVARGSLEGSWAPHTNSWDVLAGMLLVQEAGGWVNEFMAGQGLTSGNPILSSAPGMVEFFRSVCGV